MGLRQEEEPRVLTAATGRLAHRLKGMAKKGGIELDTLGFLEQRPDQVQRWLRLQRERRDNDLFQELREELEHHTGCDPAALGAALATPKPKKAEYRTPFLEALEDQQSVPREPLSFTPSALRGSAERLGIKPKADQ